MKSIQCLSFVAFLALRLFNSIPNLDCPICATTNNMLAIGTESYAIHRAIMPFERLKYFVGFGVPDFYGVVNAPTDDTRTIRVKAI